MPKISNHRVKIYTSVTEVDFLYRIDYDPKKRYFFAELPSQLRDAFASLSESELIKYNAEDLFMRGRAYKQAMIVKGASEEIVVSSMKEILNHLCNASVTRKPVIVIWFESITGDHQGYSIEKVSLEVYAQYCHEVEVPGSTPKYYKFSKSRFKEDGETKEQISTDSWRDQKAVVIPDTPENRKALETMQKNLTALIDKLRVFLASPENLLDAISKNIKLLS